jgi:DNA primase
MSIEEIKTHLTITRVLEHYGLQADKNNMLSCPFHEDKTPSLHIYPHTNTYHCFSSNCDAGTGDVIEFIQRKEKSSKHEAIVKAKTLLGYTQSQPITPEPELSRVAILTKYVESSKSSMIKSERARSYAQERGLDWQTLKLGFSGNEVSDKWSNAYKASAATIGLIGKTADGKYYNHFRNCLIFTLQNAQGHAVGIYGRSLEKGHYYLPGPHQGLYPSYPSPSTKTLILTEAIIDAATLHQENILAEDHSILACYGTNGLTSEHEQAIKGLQHLEEVILFFDGDTPGKEGTKKVAEKLQAIRKDITISAVNTPEGEDINSLQQSHQKEIFPHLLEGRTILFSIENKTTTPQQPSTYKLETFPHRLLYRTALANYHIKGELKNDFENLRVSLDIEHPQNGRKSRSKLDLYEDKQVEKIAREAAEKLSLRADLIQLDLEELTSLLEAHRQAQAETETPPPTALQVAPHVAEKCKAFLAKPDLLKRLNDLIGQAGVVGEENNRIFLFGIASSYKMPDTLHALIQGSSGSGKTHLMTRIYSFLPEGIKKKFTRLTEGNLYNWGQYELSHTLLCIEDLDSLDEKVLLALRELLSSGVLSSGTSVKNENTNGINSIQKIVYGPVASMSCTTKGEVYEDNMGRCFVLAVDESQAQTQRIIEYQNKKAAGKIDASREQEITEFLQHCIHILKPYPVINPYADKVHLPQEAHKIRRLNALYQAFVKQITLLHQYQRKTDAQGRLISQKEDLQLAAEIMFESIVLKVDELDGSLRQFYERLKDYVKSKGNGYQTYEFSQREIRHTLYVSKSQLHRYIQDLQALEYIRQAGGHSNRGFHYKILYWDNLSAIRTKVKRHLQGQLDQLELITA